MEKSPIPRIAIIFISCIAVMAVIRFILFPELFGDRKEDTHNGRVVVHYWEKWTGFEGEAMDAVIADFNASQDSIWVERLTVSEIDRKMMMATAGGNPPDVGGIFAANVNVYAEKGALMSLDKYLKKAGITKEQYIPAFWELCSHRGFMWALPSTPASLALHWNKKLFREAGLDPDHPPKTIAELDSMAELLTLVDVERNGAIQKIKYPDLTSQEKEQKKFTIAQLGFSPGEPGWWNPEWCYWFGGSLCIGDSITASSPENVKALAWVQSWYKKYGTRNMQTFGSSFGNFSSPQNAFLSGKIAMEIQGVWMYNFIDKYAPQLEWAAAAFPSVDTVRLRDVSIADLDVLTIPKGARHPDQAFVFIRYVNQQGPMEKLCMGQRKFTPLVAVSDEFLRNHPNPYISEFLTLAHSPNIRLAPRVAIWNEYNDEMTVATDKVMNFLATPQEALGNVQKRIGLKQSRVMRRWNLVSQARIKEWGSE